QARAVVDASGPGNKLTRKHPNLASLENGAYDLEPAVFTLLDQVDYPKGLIELGFSQSRFPGGYGWVFPRGERSVNVGIVIGKQHLKTASPRKLLQQWLADRWPGRPCSPFYGGAIACGQGPGALAAHGLFKAGDAASQVNPISRSGIVEAMKGGTLAAKAVVDWLGASSQEHRKAIEANLHNDWMREQGLTHQRLSRAKAAFASIPDSVFNDAANRIAKIPTQKRTLPRIFFSTLIGSPMLLWRMRSLMGF
ncbi:MAG TPA: NAD(P)/FAD-dependent oxidoreductase, partial [Fibrobacteraceae bacterium]|nr:NAD(P)/FAD-dependent oxidoreductase [Fibrobacteraceae bacterium]